MTSIASNQLANKLPTLLSARNLTMENLPWVPLAEGKWFKPMRFFSDNRGFVELLKIMPGTEIPWHRHTGEVHVFNLSGTRQLSTGELIGPGDYVYEPAGNIDSWKVTGNVPLVALVIVMGGVEYIGPDNTITGQINGETLLKIYQQYCAANNIQPLDLID